MEVTYKEKDGRVDKQITMTEEGLVRTVTPMYGTGTAMSGAITHTGERVTKIETRETDDADRLNTAEKEFSIDYVDRLLNQKRGYAR